MPIVVRDYDTRMPQAGPTDKRIDRDSWRQEEREDSLEKLSSNEHICAYLHKTRCKDKSAEDEEAAGKIVWGMERKCQSISNTDIKNVLLSTSRSFDALSEMRFSNGNLRVSNGNCLSEIQPKWHFPDDDDFPLKAKATGKELGRDLFYFKLHLQYKETWIKERFLMADILEIECKFFFIIFLNQNNSGNN